MTIAPFSKCRKAFSSGRTHGSLTLSVYIPTLSTESAILALDCLVLRMASTLDAFRSYPVARGCPALLCTTGILEAPTPRSSRTRGIYSQAVNTPRRYYRTVSRRSEPSSCRSLMDEQPNPWWLLHHQDDLGRQRCTKPQGRYVLSPATSLLPPG